MGSFKLQSGNQEGSGAQFQQKWGGSEGPQAQDTLYGLTSAKLDPMGALAQLMGLNAGRMGGRGSSSDAWGYQRENAEATNAQLRPIMDRMLGRGDTSFGAQLQNFKSQNRSRAGAGGYSRRGLGGAGAGFGGEEDEQEFEKVDPYAKVREAAMNSALQYLKIQNPHSFSSLGRK